MIRIFKFELLYFFAIFVILAIVQHPDLLTSFLTRIELIQKSGSYFHPIVWSFVFYL